MAFPVHPSTLDGNPVTGQLGVVVALCLPFSEVNCNAVRHKKTSQYFQEETPGRSLLGGGSVGHHLSNKNAGACLGDLLMHWLR